MKHKNTLLIGCGCLVMSAVFAIAAILLSLFVYSEYDKTRHPVRHELEEELIPHILPHVIPHKPHEPEPKPHPKPKP